MKVRTNILLIILFVFLDQLSKYMIRLRQPADGGFYICNQGISFGINIHPAIFWLFWITIIFFIFFGLYKKYFLHNTLYIILILSGALSNIIDRLYFGCVLDFIDLKFWPMFNLADSFIVIGAILLLYSFTKKERWIF